MNELKIEAKTDNLDTVLDFVNGFLEKTDCPMKSRTQIAIAVEEIYTNIAHYAYSPEVGYAKIRVMADPEQIAIEFEDNGSPYNPLVEIENPDITAGLDEREVGGLGMFMVRNMMDAVEYRHEDNKNLLIIKKELL